MMTARKALGFAALVAMGLILEKAAWGVFDSAAVPTGTSLKVQRVVPEGNQVAAPGRQIVVTFDRPVKTIGDLSVAPGQSPVSVSPVVACQWHWLDPRSLACELNDKNALVPATRYTVTVAPGIKSQDGA
ncbi:MAG TPA: Ig-like domain-containing protein, partial [Steroidobacteraceae bacterium]